MSLMEHAKRVANAGDAYFWLSNDAILLLRHVAPRGRSALSPRGQFGHTFQAIQVDTTTGAETALEPFNTEFSRYLTATPMHIHCVDEEGRDTRPPEIRYRPPQCAVSPDGQWLLWLSAHRTWTAASLDGRQVLRWRTSVFGSGYAIWRRNSRRWIQLVHEYADDDWRIVRATVHYLDDPDRTKEIPIEQMGDGLLAGLTDRGRVLMYNPDFYAPMERLPFVELDLSAKPAGIRHYEVALPIRTDTVDVCVSPRGGRLAWLLRSDTSAEEEPDINFCLVSDLEGNRMREIGRMQGEIERGPDGERHHQPKELCWLPDGNRLSFEFRDGIWVTPVE